MPETDQPRSAPVPPIAASPVAGEEETEASSLDRTLETVGQYRREILFVLGLVLAALVVYAVADSIQKRSEAAAAADLAEIRLTTEPAEAPDALLAVAERHEGTAAAAVATLEAVLSRNAVETDPAETVETADTFLRRHGNHAFAPQVRLIRARALVRSGRMEEAADALSDALQTAPLYLAPEMWILHAEVLDHLGRAEEAREAYLRVSQSAPGQPTPPTLARSAGLALVLLEDQAAVPTPETPETPASPGGDDTDEANVPGIGTEGGSAEAPGGSESESATPPGPDTTEATSAE